MIQTVVSLIKVRFLYYFKTKIDQNIIRNLVATIHMSYQFQFLIYCFYFVVTKSRYHQAQFCQQITNYTIFQVRPNDCYRNERNLVEEMSTFSDMDLYFSSIYIWTLMNCFNSEKQVINLDINFFIHWKWSIAAKAF